MNMLQRLKSILLITLLMWATFFLSSLFPLQMWGIVPRHAVGLWGILLSPLLHADLAHLSTNSIFFIVFGGIFASLEARWMLGKLLMLWLASGFLTWVCGRTGVHVGASSLIFALYSYLIFAGFYQRRVFYLVIGLVLLSSYSSLLWQVLPRNPGISWEGHLSGFISGALVARFLRRKNHTPKSSESALFET